MLSSLEARLRCLEICRGGRVDISEKMMHLPAGEKNQRERCSEEHAEGWCDRMMKGTG